MATTACEKAIAELRALRIQIEEDVAWWLEHDGADSERQLRLRRLIAELRESEEQAELTVWLAALPAMLKGVPQYRDYAAALLMEQECPGIWVEVFGG